MVVGPVGMDNLVQVYLLASPSLLLLFLDLGVAADRGVLHALCADSDSALVLKLHGYLLLLWLNTLAAVTVSDSAN